MSLPERLERIQEEILALEPAYRLEGLLEFSDELPTLPQQYQDHPDLLERVEECQSPVYFSVEVSSEQRVQLYATAAREAPTTRGLVSILVQGLNESYVSEVLEIGDDFPQTLGLTDVVSALRLHGMTGMLRRIKRQVQEG